MGIASRIAGSGVTPNALTIIGLAANVAVAIALAAGYLRVGGVLILLFGTLDMLDGALARVTGQSSTFGAFLDSTLDRFSEAALLLGLIVYYQGSDAWYATLAVVLCYLTAVGSLMVSYTRARAEGLHLGAEIGWFQRPERIIALGLGLIFGLTVPTLAALAVLTHVTTVQRIIHVWRATR